MSSCLECITQPDQQSHSIPSDAAAGLEDDMSSAMECIPWSDQQTESLDSKVPVIRLKGCDPKKRRRRAYFHGSSSQSMDEMRFEVHTDSEEEENKEECTEQDADTTQELTAEAIAILNAASPVADTTPSSDRQGTHIYGGTDITMEEAMSKSAEDLMRGVFRSVETMAPVMIEDTNARSHRMPSRIGQNRPWTR
jgi:hypothetical protein